MAKGSIGVTTNNIFPVIKKFLYSDHEIFLRELISNAVDATQKLKTLAAAGDFKGSTEDLKVSVTIDKDAGTLTVSDHGIGMTEQDVDKYINQIAFSGAEDFLNKYKDNANAIIGHFGLGFYSAFMVAKKVEIRTLSWEEGAKPVLWSCDGSPEFEMTECDKAERGTDIVLYIDDDEKEFLEQSRINTLLNKYCKFMPVPVIFGKEQEWKDGKYVDTDKDKVINDIEPLWSRKPTDLKDEDYIKFYHAIQPAQDDPLFWIHLNVDFPFTLTGILYFPKIKNNLDIRKEKFSAIRELVDNGILKLNVEWAAKDNEAPVAKKGNKIGTGAYIAKFDLTAETYCATTFEASSNDYKLACKTVGERKEKATDSKTKTLGFKRKK